MKRLVNTAAALLGLLVLGALAVALALTFSGLRRGAELALPSFQSPIETPTYPPPKPTPVTPPPTIPPKPSLPPATNTLPPYPPPQTPTPPETLTATPTSRATVTPSASDTPTAVPTPSEPLPPGLKVVYAETAPDGTVAFWVASAVNTESRRILTTADPARFGVHATLSHDGSWIAYTFTPTSERFAAELWVVRLDGTGRKRLASGIDVGPYMNYPIWSPDNHHVAVIREVFETSPQQSPFAYTQTISLINVDTGEEIPLVEAHVPSIEEEARRNISPLAWSADGRFLYYQLGVTGHVELWRVNVTTHAREYVNTISEQGAPRCYSLSPDGRWLLCTVLETRDPPQYAVALVPTGPGPIEILVSGAHDALYSPIWHPSGYEVTVVLPPQANEQAKLQIINVQSRVGSTIMRAEEGVFVPRAWSPDGQWLAAQKFPETYHNLFLISLNGTQIRQIQTKGGIEMIGWITADLPAGTR